MSPFSPTSFDFDVQTAPLGARPQVLLGERLMLQEAEWLHLTIGPWLAPARLSERTRTVEYLLFGSDIYEDAGSATAIDAETYAFAASLTRVDKALFELDESLKRQAAVSLATSLLSLRLLLGVRLPRPDLVDAVHIRADRLQLTHWGLESGVPLSQLLADLRSGRSPYIDTLRETLTRKHRTLSAATRTSQFREVPIDLPPLDLGYTRLPTSSQANSGFRGGHERPGARKQSHGSQSGPASELVPPATLLPEKPALSRRRLPSLLVVLLWTVALLLVSLAAVLVWKVWK